MKPKRPKSRFKAGQVVMTVPISGELPRPVKLMRRLSEVSWMDTWSRTHYEDALRPLTARERRAK